MSKYISVILVITIMLLIPTFYLHTEEQHPPLSVSPAVIDPNSYISNEPAPMGIVDFGINSQGRGLFLNSTSFEGIVSIKNLTTYNSSITGCPNDTSIQLNLNYRFNINGQNYTYWVQNVAIINTSNKEIAFFDNVWNFTSSNSDMHNSTIHGNGKISTSKSSSFYYFQANDGKCYNFGYKLIELKSISFIKAGFPHIQMEYNTGNGWVSYDILNFTFAGNISSDYGFVIDGNYINSLPVNAGLIIGGPGNATDTRAVKTNMTMLLEYWNGHNYQAVEDAYNHGTDTAEGISNISETYTSYRNMPAVSLISGNGKLGELYTNSNISIFDFRPGIQNGYVKLNGFNFNFTGDAINISLIPGNYSMELYSGSGQKIFNQNYTLRAGELYQLGARHVYDIELHEDGLAHGTKWGVSINGITTLSENNTIVFMLYNGTYNYSISSIAGYTASENGKIIVVNGTSKNINIDFSMAIPVKNTFAEYEYKLLITSVIILGVIILAAFSLITSRKKRE